MASIPKTPKPHPSGVHSKAARDAVRALIDEWLDQSLHDLPFIEWLKRRLAEEEKVEHEA